MDELAEGLRAGGGGLGYGRGYARHALRHFPSTGEALRPEEVAKRTGLKGESWRYGPRLGAWSIRSDQRLNPASLDDHLRDVLDRVEPRREVFRQLIKEQTLRADLWCCADVVIAEHDGWRYLSPDTIEISPDTVRRIADLELSEELIIHLPDEAKRRALGARRRSGGRGWFGWRD
jgi:Domain of unknown function (DUF4279)